MSSAMSSARMRRVKWQARVATSTAPASLCNQTCSLAYFSTLVWHPLRELSSVLIRLGSDLTAGDSVASNVHASLKKAKVTGYRVGMREASATEVPLVSPHVMVFISWGVSIKIVTSDSVHCQWQGDTSTLLLLPTQNKESSFKHGL